MNLPDELYREVRVIAAREDRTVTSVVEEALRRLISEHRVQADDDGGDLPPELEQALRKRPFRIEPLHGHGPLPDDLISNNAALRDFLEFDVT